LPKNNGNEDYLLPFTIDRVVMYRFKFLLGYLLAVYRYPKRIALPYLPIFYLPHLLHTNITCLSLSIFLKIHAGCISTNALWGLLFHSVYCAAKANE
jgi:hypothetical protein